MTVVRFPYNNTIIYKAKLILEHYLSEKNIERIQQYYDCQFLFISHFREIGEFDDILSKLEIKLYGNREFIKTSLTACANSLHYEFNNDHKLLTLKYLNQLVEI